MTTPPIPFQSCKSRPSHGSMVPWSKSRLTIVTLAIVSFGVFPGSKEAQGADIGWRGGGGDSLWSTSGNWSPATQAPGIGDRAVFSESGNGNTIIDLGANLTISSILFDSNRAAAYTLGKGASGSQSITLNAGGGISITSGVINHQTFNANLLLGIGGSSTAFNITNSSATAILTFAGAVQGSGTANAATLNILGVGAQVFAGGIANGTASSLAVSFSSTGTTELSGANTYTGVSTVNSGTLNITGSLSQSSTGNFFLAEGGKTNVKSGGAITNTNGTLVVGQNVGKYGKLTVDGVGSQVSVSYFLAGNTGRADVEVRNGGVINSSAGTIGNTGIEENSLLITGTGSRWDNTGTLSIGYGGKGTLTIADGGKVSTATGNVGDAAAGSGIVNISGPGSEWRSSGPLRIGNNGIGEMNISTGANVFTTGGQSIFLGAQSTAQGSLTVAGTNSILQSDALIVVGNNGKGALTINDSASVIAATGVTIAANANSSGAIHQNSGTLDVGGPLSIGAATTGSAAYYLNGGTLKAGGINGIRSSNASAIFSIGSATIAAKSDLSSSLNASIQETKTANLDSNGHTITWSGAFQGSGELQKSGAGTLILSAVNTYTGKTTVGAGTLALSGLGSLASHHIEITQGASLDVQATSTRYRLQRDQVLTNNGAVSGSIDAAAGATIGGTGTHNGNILLESGAILSPGDQTAGTLTVAGSLKLSGASTLEWKLDNLEGSAGAQWGLVHVQSLDLTSLSSDQQFVISVHPSLDIPSLWAGRAEDTYHFTFLQSDTLITGFDTSLFNIDTIPLFGLDGGAWSITSSDYALALTYTVIPEPGTPILVLMALAAILPFKAKREKTSGCQI